jgi:hypothetical protein
LEGRRREKNAKDHNGAGKAMNCDDSTGDGIEKTS